MTIKVNTSGFGGHTVKKRITVKTNDPAKKKLYLEVRGPVEAVAIIEPDNIKFNGVAGDEFEQVITITPAEKYDFSVKGISLKSDMNISADLKQPEEGSKTWQILVKNKKKNPGRYFDMITVTTTSELKPEIKIRVYGMLLPVENSDTGS